MQVLEPIKQRRSVRAYKTDPIPKEKLLKVLEAARLAPSAHNAQPFKFVVVTQEETRRKLSQAARQSFVGEAPVVIAAVSLEPEVVMSCGVPSYAVDLAIAVDHMTLQAVEEGLGTCWIGSFEQEKVKEILNIPQNHKVAALLPLGYPNDKPREKIRKNLEDLICFEQFKQ